MVKKEDPQKISTKDLYRLEILSTPSISPDGKYVVYSKKWVDRESKEKYANLWLLNTENSNHNRLTHGDQIDREPRWSPNGQEIAFLSDRGEEEDSQLHSIPPDGGEARPLTSLTGTIQSFEWKPDGRKLLLQFRKHETDDSEPVSRQITRAFYKEEGFGYLPEGRWHTWTVGLNEKKPVQITDDEAFSSWDKNWNELEPSWSPDGNKIVFRSTRSEDPGMDLEAVDLFIISLEDEKITRIPTPEGPVQKPSFSPEGNYIAYYGREGKGQDWKKTDLWIVPSNGKGSAKNLTANYDYEVSHWTLNDLGDFRFVSPTWSADGKKIFFQSTKHGNTILNSADIGSKESKVGSIVNDFGVVGDFSFDQKKRKFVYLHSSLKDPNQLWSKSLGDNSSSCLTETNYEVLEDKNLGEVETVWVEGGENNKIQGWIVKPPNFDPEKEYPSIMEIHGGPRLQYGNLFMHEFYYLAAQGYVVYYCNPRGGRGYGEEHAKAIWRNWGSADYDDLMAFANFIEDKHYIDETKMGVTGGSYGGFMTNWIIGHIDRFAAAVTQRSVSNQVSMFGSSDWNWEFQRDDEPVLPWEDLESYWKQSPIKYIDNATTPTLVIHSESDLRCPLEQGEQVYVALKRLGVDTKMVVFPEESHGLSREGRTDRRVERLKTMKNWFNKYLK
ncbi:S9 family peptidase [Candidatus Bipolaricaulota bacterium]|nr:S9 family peptidase [Candidatus Bipolaricaulota bacterium]